MAEFHLHGQIIKRSHGRSAVNAAAYRAGAALHDKRLDRTFDYTRKQEVEESIILGPDHAPKWLFHREMLWNTVEAVERHKAAQVAREFDIALPIELVREDPAAAKAALKQWAHDMFVAQDLMADINFHNMRSRNPHAHIMTTMRRVHPQAMEFGEESRYAFEETKARDQNDWGYMDFWRETWADYANAAMAEHGIDARIDHRTLIEQGITDREPNIHIGPVANAMEERGRDTGRWLKNALIWFDNEAPWFEENRRYVAFLDAEAAEERRLEEDAARQAKADAKDLAEARAVLAGAPELQSLTERLGQGMTATLDAKSKRCAAVSRQLVASLRDRIDSKSKELARTRQAFAEAAKRDTSVKAARNLFANLTNRFATAIGKRIEIGEGRLLDVETALYAAMATQLERNREILRRQSGDLDTAAAGALKEKRALLERAARHPDLVRAVMKTGEHRAKLASARLDAAGAAMVLNRVKRIAALAYRLESRRPSDIARIALAAGQWSRRASAWALDAVAIAVRGARYAGESVAYFCATVPGRRGDAIERTVTTQPEPKSRPKEEPVPEQQNDRARDDWLAGSLLLQLQFLHKNVARRERGKTLLDLSLVPERLRDDANKFHDHPTIQKWLDDAHCVQANRLMTLINGSDPVVENGKDGLRAIRSRMSPELADFADDVLPFDDELRRSALAAIQRWNRADPAATDRAGSATGMAGGAAKKWQRRLRVETERGSSAAVDPDNHILEEYRRRKGKGLADD